MKVKVQLMVSDVGHEQACGAPLRTKGHHTITFPNPLRHPHTAAPTTPPLFVSPADPSYRQSFDHPLARAHIPPYYVVKS